MKREYDNNSKKGFTLVELIVVLVILAILAATLVPALLGYIDKANANKVLVNARACFDAAQSLFVEQYAKNGEVAPGTAVMPGAKKVSSARHNFDQDMVGSDFANKVLELAGMTGENEPYCFMIAVGSNSDEEIEKVTVKDKYTIYLAFYQEKKDGVLWFYYDGNWSNTSPRKDNNTDFMNDHNVVQNGPLKDKRLQYYLISNRTDNKDISKSEFWDWFKQIEKKTS